MQVISVTPPHIMAMVMPQPIMRFIMSQHMAIMSMPMAPAGFIMQRMPVAVISHVMAGIIGMPQHIIIGMPLQVIMQGMPQSIIDCIMAQQSFIMSIDMPSAGIIMHSMPSAVMLQVMWHIIGDMPIIMGIVIGMPEFISGMAIFIWGIAFMCVSLEKVGPDKRRRDIHSRDWPTTEFSLTYSIA